MKLARFIIPVAAAAAAWGLTDSSAEAKNPESGRFTTDIREVPFTKVRFTDKFWAPRIETNRTVSIPSAFRQCEINGRFDNFAIAGGLKKGEHRGDFSFDDTDPYKIIEGASYSLAAHYDPKLDAYLDSVINIIAAAQEPDGYLTTCVTNRCERLSGWWGKSRWEKINSHELYNSGHLYEAAVAHYLATGKRSLLDVALKNADLVCKVFGPAEGQKHVPSGHPIVEMALVKLYNVTGKDKYLKTAKYFVEETGRGTDGHRLNEYSQDHEPILQQDEIRGHAVRAGYLYSGVADVAALTGDTAYFDALERIWNNMASKKLFITGGIGSRPQGEGFGPNYELHNHTAYCETCAAIANVYWNHRMFLYTGDSGYADIVERALYNGVISGVSLSGDRFFYDNPLESMGEHQRAPWFGCACCPGNITRFMASVPLYMYATRGNDVYVNLYGQSEADVETEDNKLKISQITGYPWNGNVLITVNPENRAKCTMRLRIPGWASGKPVPSGLYSYAYPVSSPVKIKVNGLEVKYNTEKGYALIDREWSAGDRVEIDFPMQVNRVKADYRALDDRGKFALERGPVVYCLEGPEMTDSVVFDKYLPSAAMLSASMRPDLLGGVEVLEGTARKVLPDGSEEDVSFTAIPYSVWNNRGPAEMSVWLPFAAKYARPVPASTIASRAKMFSEPSTANPEEPAATSNLQEAWGYNDQWEPASSSDNSKPYHYWWLRKGTKENIGYEFDKEEKISSVDVYWLDLDHYDGDFRTPESWTLYYRDKKGKWKPVEAKTPFGVEKNRYNHMDFKPVKTKALKLVAQLRKGVSGGVIEWKVN